MRPDLQVVAEIPSRRQIRRALDGASRVQRFSDRFRIRRLAVALRAKFEKLKTDEVRMPLCSAAPTEYPPASAAIPRRDVPTRKSRFFIVHARYLGLCEVTRQVVIQAP